MDSKALAAPYTYGQDFGVGRQTLLDRRLKK